MTKTKHKDLSEDLPVLNIGKFGFLVCFGFGISCFGFPVYAAQDNDIVRCVLSNYPAAAGELREAAREFKIGKKCVNIEKGKEQRRLALMKQWRAR